MPNNIALDFQALDIYSLTVYNNKIQLIDEIIIKNDSDYDLKNFEVEVSSYPSFFAPFVTKISLLSSGRYIILDKQELEIDVTKVMYSPQPVLSLLSVKIKSMGEILVESTKNVTVLPYDFIPPISSYTELISSFVTPNQNEIKDLTKLVFDKIKKIGTIPQNSDMWDYNNKNTTLEIIKAIYSVMCDLKITLNFNSAFSDSKPTRVKLPEKTLSTRNATSLEIALLCASLSELVGINPFLVFSQDKALVGFHFSQECFNTVVLDDGRKFLNLCDGVSEGFCVLDATSMINGTQVLFEDSLKSAQKAIGSADYFFVVDIKKARNASYKPLPNRTIQNDSIIFEISHDEKGKAKTLSSFSALTSLQAFAEKIKAEIFPTQKHKSSFLISQNKSIFLVGNAKHILSKLFLNGRVMLKPFPFQTSFDSESNFIDKLNQLNESVDPRDVTNTINVCHDKPSLNKRLISVTSSESQQIGSPCLSVCTLKYKNNSEICFSPLFLAPVSLDFDGKDIASIKLLSSDFIVNITLLNMLKKAGVIIDTDYFSGKFSENFDLLVQKVSEAIDGKEFELCDFLTISSFDIEGQELSNLCSADYFENSDLLKNIFAGKEIFDSNNQDSIDKRICDSSFSLDASQMKAIETALKNQCTVIKGANGSGKTRVASTIAFSELIADKKVLYFTASKNNEMAFLNFSKQAGFENQIAFLRNDESTFNSFDYLSNIDTLNYEPQDVEASKSALESVFASENCYYENLHKVNEIGFSLYEAASQYERFRSFPYSVNFINSDIAKLSRDDVVVWFDAVSSLAKAGADCKEPYSNPLFYIKEENFTYELKSSFTISLSSHISILQQFIELQNEIVSFLGIESPVLQEKQTLVLLDALKLLKENGEYIFYGIFNKSAIESDFSRIEAFSLQSDDFFELKTFFATNFTEDIINLDCDALLYEWRSATSKFAFYRSSAQASVKNKLRAYALDSKFVTNENFVTILNNLSRYKSIAQMLEENSYLIYQTIGIDVKSMIDAEDQNLFDLIRKKISVSKEYISLLSCLCENENVLLSVYTHQSSIFKSYETLAIEIEKFYDKFCLLYNDYIKSEEQLLNIIDIDVSRAKSENNKIWYYFAPQFYTRILDNIDFLKYWCSWNIEKKKAISLGLSNVVSLYESEKLTSNDIKNAFLKGFFKAVTEYFLSIEPSFSDFSSGLQGEKAFRIFAELSAYQKKLQRDFQQRTFDKLREVVKENDITLDKALQRLKDDFSFKINFNASKSSVQLLQSAKPCFVVSSINEIARFYKELSFDTIIIDCPSESVQSKLFMLLPLTKKLVLMDSSFSYSSSSFCDYFINAGVEVSTLEWIYNTNYASSLVNELFYSNTLSSFVSNSFVKNGLSVIIPNGTYDKRKTRVNVIEASATVDEVFKFKNEFPDLSIGVYAMTREQSELINVLYHKRLGITEYESKSTINSSESMFIRCISEAEYETRDIIIFSTTYSLEEKQKYGDALTKSMPELSDSNSLRKLADILLSAPSRFVLVTSLTVDTLERFKTTEKNFVVFKKLISRLLDKNKTLIQDSSVSLTQENSIIRAVSNHIESLGYKVDLNLGVNKCKVDIAVKSKNKTGYILGIIFDESIYVNSKNFLSRDLIIRGLEKFGKWKLLRIYTVEWFENYSKQLDIISSVLDESNTSDDLLINKIGE